MLREDGLVGFEYVTSGHMHTEMFVHKSGVYVTGTGVSGDSSFTVRGSSVAAHTSTHDSDLVLEK